jgi:hypothetical protein
MNVGKTRPYVSPQLNQFTPEKTQVLPQSQAAKGNDFCA